MGGNETGPGDVLPYAATERTLANGLRVIVVPTGFPNLVSLQIPVKTGSRNEVESGKSGFAHFFEHMMFRGTKRYPVDAYQAIVSRTGARQNAYTTDDYTNYHLTFAKEDLERILELEADRFMNLDYAEADFRTEARAVLGEYNKSSADPLTKLIEVQREHAYNVHTYKHTTMGFLADIERMPQMFEYSRTFFARWYRPEHATVILAGDVEAGPAMAMVERAFGAWRPGNETAVEIPAEPESAGPIVAHVPWASATLPWVSVGFHGPAFSERDPSYAALDALLDLTFGETSDVYQQLVERDQVVDQFFPYLPASEDPGLATIFARVKRPEDAPAVREAILEAVAAARHRRVSTERLSEAISNSLYGFARTLDNSESIAGTLARYVRFRREYGTVNELYRTYARLTPDDLQAAARRFLTDARMVLATLSHGDLPTAAVSAPAIPATVAADSGPAVRVIERRGPSPLLRFKLLFRAGAANDPAGKEGLAALAAAMIAEAGSTQRRVDEINRALFPLAATFGVQVDREMTTFTGVAHRDNLRRFLDVALPQLLSPGYREEDFARLKESQRNELVVDLRGNNEEELGKERLQANIFGGTPYGHPCLGTVAGIEAVTIEDIKAFVRAKYTRANLTLGLTGDFRDDEVAGLRELLEGLPAGKGAAEQGVAGRVPPAIEVEIIAKETRATAISFGHPIAVTRAHEDFAALWLARAWLGEHRERLGRLFQRIRELRGLNYGDYAYIEAFPRGMYQFFPDPNLGRRAQVFEVWIRPVVPEHAVFALKAALFELRNLVARGLSEEDFQGVREYLMKNVYVMTKTQDQQLGYALDSDWYGMGDFVATMRERLQALTCDEVNAAIRRHLSGEQISVVMVTKDAEGLKQALLARAPTTIVYESEKPPEAVAEDMEIGALQLGLTEDRIRITPVEDVFAS